MDAPPSRRSSHRSQEPAGLLIGAILCSVVLLLVPAGRDLAGQAGPGEADEVAGASSGTSEGVALAGAGIGSLSDSEPWVRSVIVGSLAAQVIGVIQAQVLTSPTIQVRPEVEPGAGRWGLQVKVRP